jgi:hypothetical protein
VDENILAAFSFDKTVTLFRIKPFNLTLHKNIPPKKISWISLTDTTFGKRKLYYQAEPQENYSIGMI